MATRWSIGGDGNRLAWDGGPIGDPETVEAIRAYIKSGRRLSPDPTATPLPPDESRADVWFVAAWLAFVASNMPFTVTGRPPRTPFTTRHDCTIPRPLKVTA